MEAISVRDYRNNMASSFARADRGEKVLIRRRNQLYALTKVQNEISPELQQHIKEAREAYKAGKTISFKSKEELNSYLDSL